MSGLELRGQTKVVVGTHQATQKIQPLLQLNNSPHHWVTVILFCFSYRDRIESGSTLLQLVDVFKLEVFFGGLDGFSVGLGHCTDQAVVLLFLSLVHLLRVVLCYTLLQQNKKLAT